MPLYAFPRHVLAFILISSSVIAQDGTLDITFGTGGKSYVTPPGLNQSLSKTVVQPDGKIVLVGRSSDGLGYTFAVARFTADGRPDSSFDGDGVTVTQLVPGSRNDNVTTVAVQADGKIIAGGNSNNNFVLVRYNVDGSLDASFNGTGIVNTPLPGSSVIYSVVVLSSGRILAGGSSNPASTLSDFTLVRYNSNGTPDVTFDGDGIVITDINNSSSDILYALAVQPDGKFYAAGSSQGDMALVRYNANGSLDNSFNGNGKTLIDFGLNEAAYSIAIQADQKLVLAGVITQGQYVTTALARILPGGQPDNSFDFDGKASTMVGEFDQYYAVLIQQDAKIVVSGITYSGGTSDFLVVRYNTDGSLDNSFDNDGKLTIDMGSAEAFATVAAWNTTLVLGGYSSNQLAVTRLINSSTALVLPIRLLNFAIARAGQAINLNWKVAGTNLLRFEVEQSEDGVNFSIAGSLPASSHSYQEKEYCFVIESSSTQVRYYRLRIVEGTGFSMYSPILSTRIANQIKPLILAQNVVRNELRLQLEGDDKTILSILDTRGVPIITRKGFSRGTNAFTVNISNLPKGIYYIVVAHPSGLRKIPFFKD